MLSMMFTRRGCRSIRHSEQAIRYLVTELTAVPSEGPLGPPPSTSGIRLPAGDPIPNSGRPGAGTDGQQRAEADRGNKESSGTGSDVRQYRSVGQGPYLMEPGLPMPSLIVPTRTPKLPPMDFMDAVGALKGGRKAKFVESVEVAMRLGIDPRRGDQMVRGVTSLPHGTGKEPKVAIFTGQDLDLSTASGADLVGGEELIAKILAEGSGGITFDQCLATPDIMPKVARIARILGPRGLMPNPKLGTIVPPEGLSDAVRAIKAGRVEYRADKGGVVHACIGKLSFSEQQLYRNFGVFAGAIMLARPKGAKGSGVGGYVLAVHLSRTMGPGIPINLPSMVAAISDASRQRR